MTVRLGINPDLKYSGDTISFVKGAFTPHAQRLYESSLLIDAYLRRPKQKLGTTALISGNSVYGTCDIVQIHGRGSQGGGGRLLKYIWDVDLVADVVDLNSLQQEDLDKLMELRSSLSNLPRHQNHITFPASHLLHGVVYNFSLTVENFLNMRSDPVYLSVTQTGRVIPVVTIAGSSVQTIKASELTLVLGKARLPKCAGTKSALLFFWEIDSVAVQLDSKTRESSRLYIHPGTLTGGHTYTLTLTVSVKRDPSAFAMHSVRFKVVSSPLIARILGGSRRIVSAHSDFVLDGSLSEDPDRETTSVAWYEWECEELNGASCFVRNHTNPNNDEYIRLNLPMARLVTIRNGTFDSGKTYLFRLKYFKGARQSSTEILVTVRAGNPPNVRLVTGNHRTKERTNRRIWLRGYIKTHSQDTLISFECVSDNTHGYIDVQKPGVLLTPYEVKRQRAGFHEIGIVFRENVLEEGVSYRFTLHAQNQDGAGSSEVTITINDAPSPGALTFEHENNTALVSDFLLSATNGWKNNEDVALLYNFGFVSPNDGEKRYLGENLLMHELLLFIYYCS